MKSNEAMRIEKGYKDMRTGDHGNAIDYLVRYLGYGVPDAAVALTAYSSPVPVLPEEKPKRRELPTKSKSDYSVKKYLLGRGIDHRLIDSLFSLGLLYQDEHRNCVFVSHNRDYAEVRASNEIPMKNGKPYRDNFANGGYCWYMYLGEKPKKGYLCEGAIDAISLAQILKEDAYYISVGGAAQAERIKKVVGLPLEIVLAVDNDEAGDKCREDHMELSAIIPDGVKDWNEMLQKGGRHGTITARDAANAKRQD